MNQYLDMFVSCIRMKCTETLKGLPFLSAHSKDISVMKDTVTMSNINRLPMILADLDRTYESISAMTLVEVGDIMGITNCLDVTELSVHCCMLKYMNENKTSDTNKPGAQQVRSTSNKCNDKVAVLIDLEHLSRSLRDQYEYACS